MSRRIMVFNHSPHLLKLYQLILQQRDYHVLIFEENQQSAKLVQSILPDLVILGNIKGHCIDEFDVLLDLRINPITQYIPVLICTTSLPDLQRMVADWNFSPIASIEKPFNSKEFLIEVERLLTLAPGYSATAM